MAAINHIDKRADALPRFVLGPYRAHHFAIDRGDLFALAQVSDGGGAAAPAREQKPSPLCSDALPLYHRANTTGIQRSLRQGRISCVATLSPRSRSCCGE